MTVQVDVRGHVQWVSNGSFADYEGESPWFEMVISTDSGYVIMVACEGVNFDYPKKYTYDLALKSAPRIMHGILEHLKPTIIIRHTL